MWFGGILDADKEGFLRSETSLIQTIGRAARNVDSKVILYADKVTKSIDKALSILFVTLSAYRITLESTFLAALPIV